MALGLVGGATKTVGSVGCFIYLKNNATAATDHIMVAIISNLISAKAAAVLFTPIAVGISQGLGVPVEPFAVAVIFAANCAIATPMGYQTSLLVMGPGHYTFGDFARGGIPLIIILWITFSFFSYGYYNLN